MAEIPAGWTIIGSPKFKDAPPHWRYVDRFFIGTSAVAEDQAHKVIGIRQKPGGKNHIVTDERWNHPAVYISWNDAISYVKTLNEMMAQRKEKWRFGLPSEAVPVDLLDSL